MIVFDFDNGVDGRSSLFFTNAAQTLSYTDDDGGGVTFTLSTSSITGFGIGTFFGTFAQPTAAGFEMNDANGDDVFTLTFGGALNTGAGTTAVAFEFGTLVGSWNIQPMTTGGALGPGITVTAALANGGTTTLPGTAGVPFVSFVFSAIGGGLDILGIESLTVNCFAKDTLIATPDGPRQVQNLTPGDRISTAPGGETEVKWLGEQRVPARFLHPARINPICIKASALADGVPSADLYVSPDHAIALDGLLINAIALVNGRTIYQVRDMPLDGFSYYHIETDTHELILAEGCPTESYLDIPSRDAFVNGDERANAPVIQEMDMLRISSPRLLPEAIKARLGIVDRDVEFSAFEDDGIRIAS